MFRKAEEGRERVDKYTYIYTHTNKIPECGGREKLYYSEGALLAQDMGARVSRSSGRLKHTAPRRYCNCVPGQHPSRSKQNTLNCFNGRTGPNWFLKGLLGENTERVSMAQGFTLSSDSGPEKPQSQVSCWSIHHHCAQGTSPGAAWTQGSPTSLVPESLACSFMICKAAFEKHPMGSTQKSLLMLAGP